MFKVTVKVESFQYVARTQDGVWHTKGSTLTERDERNFKVKPEIYFSGMQLAGYLYHPEEIGFVETKDNGETVIYLLEVGESDIHDQFMHNQFMHNQFMHNHVSIRSCIDELEMTLNDLENVADEDIDWQRIAKMQELAEALAPIHSVIRKLQVN